MFRGGKTVATIFETEGMPLSKEALERVLAEMRQDAA